MPITRGYSATHIALHWIIAILIVWNWVFSDGMGKALDQRVEGAAVAGWVHYSHIGVGSAILALTILRLTLRRVEGVPKPKRTAWPLIDRFALWTHRLQYGLLILVPSLGLIAWFARFPGLGDWHVYAMNALMILILLHAAAALFHQFVLKDGILWRMARPE